jgi:hypothetical protein
MKRHSLFFIRYFEFDHFAFDLLVLSLINFSFHFITIRTFFIEIHGLNYNIFVFFIYQKAECCMDGVNW